MSVVPDVPINADEQNNARQNQLRAFSGELHDILSLLPASQADAGGRIVVKELSVTDVSADDAD